MLLSISPPPHFLNALDILWHGYKPLLNFFQKGGCFPGKQRVCVCPAYTELEHSRDNRLFLSLDTN